ncbi:unnamed protein product, partial [Laminaria digitata]
ILDGRVKTLHPKIHGGLLANRALESHLQTMRDFFIPDIPLVVVNLYPFEEAAAREDASLQDVIENIDIGGPCMLRAGAKNFASVTVVVDPDDYNLIIDRLDAKSLAADVALRQRLALKAFSHCAEYDSAIVSYLSALPSPTPQRAPSTQAAPTVEQLPDTIALEMRRTESLRYGENPHQLATLYHTGKQPPLGGITQLHGKSLSYNNIIDLDAALELVSEFDDATAAIIKHTNPAGCASADTIEAAFTAALECDPTSAFGGIVALNRAVSPALASALSGGFFEVIAAPHFEEEALALLAAKKNVRLMRLPTEALSHPAHRIEMTSLGILVQQSDPRIDADASSWEVVTERAPDARELEDLAFAWRVCKHVKSNAIVLARDGRTVGVGAGQMSRVDAVELAISKRLSEEGAAVLASDAFFPFRDGPDAAALAGVTAIIQPGGSRRDQEVIDACNEHGVAMLFTGKRHFKH